MIGILNMFAELPIIFMRSTREIYGISKFGSKQELIVQRAEIGINLTLKKGKEPIRYQLELQHSSHFVLLLALKSCR